MVYVKDNFIIHYDEYFCALFGNRDCDKVIFIFYFLFAFV